MPRRASCARPIGMGGQKCSATSRLYVESDRRGRAARAARRGGRRDPHRRSAAPGELAGAGGEHGSRMRTTRATSDELRSGGATCRPADASCRGPLGRGYYVEPVLAEAALAHRLWRHEMFLPILTVHRVRDRERGDGARQRFRPWPDRGFLRRGGRDCVVPGAHRGGRHLRQSPAGRDHGRVAGLPAVWRLEGIGFHGQGDRVFLLPAAVPARAVAHGRGARMARSCRSPQPSAVRPDGAASPSRVSRT